MEHDTLQPSEEANPLPRLPACRFCHARKAKCDNARPKCSLCVKHDEECMTLGLENDSFSRQYIGDLEQEIGALERQAQAFDAERPNATLPQGTESSINPRQRSRPSNLRTVSRQEGSHSPNFVEGGGISFMRHLVADSGWREHDPTLLQNLTRHPGPAEAGIKPHPLPTATEGRRIFDNYLNGSHVQNPFFLRREVQKICDAVFPSEPKENGNEGHDNSTQNVPDHHLFRAFMILAVGSITLDRPCAIPEKYIRIGFPADANDEEIEAADVSGSFSNLDSFCVALSNRSPSAGNTEMSVFFACLRLRQITSSIHSKFGDKATSTKSPHDTTARGAIYDELEHLLGELHQWRVTTPTFDNPRSLYEMQDWYDLLYFRERLQLVRKAIDLVPKQNGIPPRDLLSLCLQCATGAIVAFWKLFEPKKITFTRSYFQMLFTAGLSIMYCLSVVGDFDHASMRAGTEAVTTCELILKQMGVDLSDAKRYVAVYEALRGYVIRKYSRHLQTDPQHGDSLCASTSHFNQSSSNVAASHGERCDNDIPSTQIPSIRGLGFAHNHTQQPLGDLPLLDTQLVDLPVLHDTAGSLYNDASISEGSVLSWNIFGDDALWNMEAGLNEYAYGDPPATLYLEDPFDLQNIL
ncbi:uncharacterized protein N7496_009667 [Penicillium cataractarum]|uniref:Zn(2)-C6 fungal-type domain-containing protein n=1 Tax=Penicillium cataractarum TaxID=2100454 RepID=A0A9W9V170_9EURO|nr:uncharacterized protein N7496_009667 [Penicillium cataractarum]KAJ5363954.1 hypothetical protein N7496_009667 [Penicillium cataractarum]